MKPREQVSENFKWKLEHVFATVEDWNKAVEEIEEKAKGFEAFKGKLRDPNILRECMSLENELFKRFSQIILYASLKSDEDTRISENQALKGRAMQTVSLLKAASSFLKPELIEIGEDLKTLTKEEGLGIYEKYFDDIIRAKAHILDPEKEELLAQLGELNSASSSIFGMINNADMLFEDAIDSEGKPHKLTHSSAREYSESYDRELRKSAATNALEEYKKRKNTIGQTFLENLKKDRVIAKVRNYNSSIEMKLSEDNIPLSVYNNLLEVINENRGAMHKLSKLRKKALGVDTLYSYDMTVPLIKDAKNKIDYKDAVNSILESLKILGSEYFENAKKGFENGWVDVYENEGKRSGAYSWSAPGVHPFILMNYNNTVGDMFTLTHEMGHAMHSFFTDKHQIPLYSNYSIFLAEIASTVNEALLHEHLMKTTTDKKMRAFLLSERIKGFVGTIFRQAMFAEFEKKAHDLAREGSPTIDKLNEIFDELMRKDLGDVVNFIEGSEINWSRIPHFYRSFYVYQYATGFCASIAIVENIKKNGQKGVDQYFNMLNGGSSKYPIDLLKDAGVDLTTKEPLEAAMKYFAELVDELEKTLEEI